MTHCSLVARLTATWVLSFVAFASAADLAPGITIDSQGFSASRLAKVGVKIDQDVANAMLPGAVLLVSRNGVPVYAHIAGAQIPATAEPMRRDSIFRIHSLTKPIVSVAVMMLVEEGKLALADPASKYLPELKNLQVGVERSDAAGVKMLDLIAATREMSIHDLLRHSAGLTYAFEGKSLVKDEYKKLGLDGVNETSAEWIQKLAKAPLQSQPGSRFEYSVATVVLGVILERVSGQSLDALLAARIFRPLKMHDTGFTVEPSKHARIAEPYEIDSVWKIKTPMSDPRKTPPRFSGGGGLMSTADDYLRFAQMLLNGGELDGARILSPKTIELMLADHLPVMRLAVPTGQIILGPRPGYGFGLGFAVRTDLGGANTPGSIGIADWNGISGTNFWIDPKEKLAVVWMMQAPGSRPYYRQIIANMVYAAMVK